MTEAQREAATLSRKKIAELRGDLQKFSAACLKVKNKGGVLEPLILNRAQLHLHEVIEKQRAETGMVRVIVLKGRRMGISTYAAARFYHRASMNRGQDVYILTHQQAATDYLFGMVDRFHRYNPLKPRTGTANVKQLSFDALESGYAVATAGAKAGGRSRNITLLHWSEVAFSANASDHFASAVQAVPNLPGTEIILESTANGVTGEFYERWQQAEAGLSQYIPVFLPWYWDQDNRSPCSQKLVLSTDSEEGELSEAEYAEFGGLDDEQVMWMRHKIADLRSLKLFHQEYPLTAGHAFQTSEGESFIKAPSVVRAMKRDGIEGHGPLVFGVDPAGPGGDRFAICARRGHKVEWVLTRNKVDAVEAAHWLKALIEEHKPDRVFIDAGGIGHAVISMVKSFDPRYVQLINAVDFGSTSEHKKAKPHVPGPALRRDEMWLRMKEWLDLEEGVSIPDSGELQTDLCSVRVKLGLTNDTKLESKKDLKSRGGKSPDLADALALTFASLAFIKAGSGEARLKSAIPAKLRRMAKSGGSTTWMGR